MLIEEAPEGIRGAEGNIGVLNFLILPISSPPRDPNSRYSPTGRTGAGGPSKAEVGAGGEKLGGEGDGSTWGWKVHRVIPGMWEGFTSFSSHRIFNSCPITCQHREWPKACIQVGAVADTHINS